jgi:dihydroorotate dehydrogenase electron transfer subunit
VVGRGTALLSDKKKGDTLRVITPLGKGFRIVKGKAALFAGGRGAAPLYYLARKLENPVVFYAGKTAADLPLAPLFEKVTSQLHLITEDGSVGKKGLITDFIPETDFDMVYVVGPEEMMRKFAEIYRNRKTPVEFSFERRMGCGFGVCFGCAVKVVRDGQEIYVRACKEGPVFSLQEVVWT